MEAVSALSVAIAVAVLIIKGIKIIPESRTCVIERLGNRK